MTRGYSPGGLNHKLCINKSSFTMRLFLERYAVGKNIYVDGPQITSINFYL